MLLIIRRTGTHQARFIYNENTNKFIELENEPEPNNLNEDLIYVDNIANRIYDLYVKNKPDLDNLFNNKVFLTIARYFDYCFQQQSDKWKMKPERMYHAFVIPNEWQLESNIITHVLVPMFNHIGISFPHYNYEREQFMTEAEVMLVHCQGWSEPYGRQPFMYGESRCILHDVYFESDGIRFKTTYFQLKQHNDLRDRGMNYCTPKIGFVHEGGRIDYTHFEYCSKDFIEDCVLKLVLEIDDDTVSKMRNDRCEGYESVADYISDSALFNARVSIYKLDQELIFTRYNFRIPSSKQES